MVGGSGSGKPKQGPGSNPAFVESAGGRLRFRVDLQPGETTVVSWKNLLKEANLSDSNRPESSSGPSFEAKDGLAFELPPPVVCSSPKKNTENEAGSNRLSTVIERIERMYAGNGSSDEEDLALDNMPDDDEYDTDDSFIDDTELDDYFQVDNSAVKHGGFFVNRGVLETIEATVSIAQQPKKKRPKELTKGGGSDEGHTPHKVMKMGNKGKKASSSIQTGATSQFPKEAPNVHLLVQNPPANAAEVSIDNAADIQVTVDPSGRQKGDAKRHDKNSHKVALVQGTKGPSVGAKSIILEKAIRELEKTVAELRPPPIEAQDPDNASQAVKRRLPPEIKQKLVEVAKIAGEIYGKVPKDVIDHLMSIVGHLMHIKTLKRHLKDMANMQLHAKQEREDLIQRIKHEVTVMVNSRMLRMKSELEQHGSNSDDFLEAGPEEKEALIQKYIMDDLLENKICDLYVLYVERVEEDSGPPVRMLYEELALLWPSGFMHADRIKRAIYRAKVRQGLFSNLEDQEKIKKKKTVAPKAMDAVTATQPLDSISKLLSAFGDPRSTLPSNPVPGAVVGLIAPCPPVSVANRPDQGRSKHEKMKKGSSSSNPIDVMLSNALPKQKGKSKASAAVAEAQLRFERLAVSQSEKPPKPRKRSGH